MKTLKRLLSAALALTLAFGLLATSAFAAGETKGSITIEQPVKGATYKVYKLLDLVDYASEAGHYYKITSSDPWYNFFSTGAGAEYVNLEETATTGTYVVSWKKKTPDTTEKDAAAFAQAAKAYAEDTGNGITAASENKAGDGNLVFDTLDFGYYLVTSSEGVVCNLTSTDPTATIHEKNQAPGVTKKIVDGEGNEVADHSASVGDTVHFKITVTLQPNGTKYVLHDRMDEAFKLDNTSIAVKKDGTALTKDTDYSVAEPGGNHKFGTETAAKQCTFDLSFTETYLKSITAETKVTVTYSATVVSAASSIKNNAWVTYGDGGETPPDPTETKTFSFDLVKTKADNTVLTGAKFKLYDAETGGNEIQLVKDGDHYRVATAEEQTAGGFTSAVIEAGQATVKGLKKGTYWLEETEAPADYNPVKGRIKVEIADKDLTATVENDKWTSGGVQVINKTGAELPTTGGMGTRLFYIFGSILAVGAAVLLITKKRMNAER